MTQYDNNMRGVLFKNDRKEKDSHPDYKGSCEVNGVEMWLSAWIKEGAKGKFMSLSFQPKEDQEQNKGPRVTNNMPAPRQQVQKPSQRQTNGGFEDMDSDIPFSDPLKRKSFALSI